MNISVVVCTHNPRRDFLERTFAGLKDQSLDQTLWELVLIDNASKIPVTGTFDLSWHLNAKCVREENLGLTRARLRGIRESAGELLIFVDDDNILGVNYLKNALEISRQFPFLGAWGGSCIAEYEKSPPAWFLEFEGNVAVRKVNQVTWSNQYFDYAATPVGAGMCLRKAVAHRYDEGLKADLGSLNLDRKGDSLMSCGDHHMAWTSIGMGLGVGVFPSLELVHIIPEGRIEESYLLKLLEADACSAALLRANLTGERRNLGPTDKKTLLMRSVGRQVRKWLNPKKFNPFHEKVRLAKQRGHARAAAFLSGDAPRPA